MKTSPFSAELIHQLAAELNQSEKSRVQVEHFSKRFPGMTVEDGYAVSRAWVKMKLAEGRVARGHAHIRRRTPARQRHRIAPGSVRHRVRVNLFALLFQQKS